jgi:hypothetical protein
MEENGFLEQLRFHYITSRKEVIGMEGKSKGFFAPAQLIGELHTDRNEKVECCCHEACYGLVLGKFEYNSECCK